MPQWLYRIQPVHLEMLTGKPVPDQEAVLAAHFDYLQGLHEQGVVHMAGRSTQADYSSFGIVLFRADNEGAAQDIMRADPAVRARLFRAELFPWRTALPVPGQEG